MSTLTDDLEVKVLSLVAVAYDHGATDDDLVDIESDIQNLGLPVTYPDGAALLINGRLLASFPSVQKIEPFRTWLVQQALYETFMLGVDAISAEPDGFPTAPEPIACEARMLVPGSELGEACILLGEAAQEFADARKCCTSAEEQLTLAGKIHAMKQKKAQFEAIIAGQPWKPTPFEANHCLHCGDVFEKAPNDIVGLCNDCIPF